MIETKGKLLQRGCVSSSRHKIRTHQNQKLLSFSLWGHPAKLLLIEHAYVRLSFSVFGRLLLNELLQAVMLHRRYYQGVAIMAVERDREDNLIAQILAK